MSAKVNGNHHHHSLTVDDIFLIYRDETLFNNKKSIQEVLKKFDKDGDGSLSLTEFEELLKSLFSFNGKPYSISKSFINESFNYFDSNKNQKLSLSDFENFWFKIIKPTLLPRSSLVIVDVQNDFIDGTLALRNCEAKQDGAEVLPFINELIETVPFNVITYSLDWHPADHCSFIENVKTRKLSKNSPKHDSIKVYDTVVFEDYPDIGQKLWPAHCIQNSPGAELHPKLKVVDEASDIMKRKVVYVYKGSRSDIDSYSAFFDNCKLNETTLNRDLKKHDINDIYVCGLAADVCVAATSSHGLDLKYRVIYIEDASRGVDTKDIVDQKKRLVNNGAIMVNTNQVKNMVTSVDRRPELAYATFKHLVGK